MMRLNQAMLRVGMFLLCFVGVLTVSALAQEAEQTGKDKIAGTYNLVSIDGSALPCAPMHQGEKGPEVTAGVFTVNDDGTVLSSVNFTVPGRGDKTRDVSGVYTGKGPDLVVSWKGAGKTKVTIEGSKLTMLNEGMLFVYELPSGSDSPAAATAKSKGRSDGEGMGLLSKYVGEWDAAIRFEEAPPITAKYSAKLVLGDKFVQQAGCVKNADGTTDLEFSMLMNYDPDEKVFRKWSFLSSGETGQEEGTWDAATKTMTWVRDGDETISTVKDDLAKDGIIEWKSITKNQAGDVVWEMSGTNTRR